MNNNLALNKSYISLLQEIKQTSQQSRLKAVNAPISVSEYQINKSFTSKLPYVLPTIEELEEELSKEFEEDEHVQ